MQSSKAMRNLSYEVNPYIHLWVSGYVWSQTVKLVNDLAWEQVGIQVRARIYSEVLKSHGGRVP